MRYEDSELMFYDIDEERKIQMETINGAKLTVTLQINEDRFNELKAQGYSDTDIEKMICKAITLTDIPLRSPVEDIISVELVKYF